MPLPPPSRRTVLQLAGLGALGLVSGCTGDDDKGGSPGPKGEPDPDLDLLARAIDDKQTLLESYDDAVASPKLAARLGRIREDHAAHLAALKGFRPDLPSPVASDSGSPRPSSGPGPGVPADPDQAVEQLAKAELAAAGRRVGMCREARDPKLARLLASVGGSEAAHTAVLRAGNS